MVLEPVVPGNRNHLIPKLFCEYRNNSGPKARCIDIESHEKTCVFAGVFNDSMEHDSQIWGTSDSLESLVPIPKPDEFPFSDSDSDSKKFGNWNRNHLIPFADETTVYHS